MIVMEKKKKKASILLFIFRNAGEADASDASSVGCERTTTTNEKEKQNIDA